MKDLIVKGTRVTPEKRGGSPKNCHVFTPEMETEVIEWFKQNL